jgi:hypothetical protein
MGEGNKRRLIILAGLVLALSACGSQSEMQPSPASPRKIAKLSATTGGSSIVLAGAGDIASCSSQGDEATARLLARIPGTIFTAGDDAYEAGTAAEFARCYGPSWGRYKARTHPALGNHEYVSGSAAAYFRYFGKAAGDPRKGYYSYTLGRWHIVVINSNCDFVGGCGTGSAQERWLRADLARHPSHCTIAYWHHPRFSSGLHGSSIFMAPIWRALYNAGADVVISAHDHDYERFGPQDPDGRPDPRRGIREFVVGTGGKSYYPFGSPLPNSEIRNSGTFGVLKLTLRPRSYSWRFIPVAGKSFTDAGKASCH